MDLVKILEQTISPNQEELRAAQQHLEDAAKQNLSELLIQLSLVLRQCNNSHVARMQAGLQLKNFLYSKDVALKAEYQARWMQLSEDVRHTVRQNALDTLGTEPRPSSAAQCVAYIACTELPLNLWPELIVALLNNVTNAASTEILKESTLEAIGYICQDIDPEILKRQANEILTAIVTGIRKEEPSVHVKLAANRALLNSLEFTKANFEKDQERNYIMQVVCEATQCADTNVKVAALQCLVKIMSLYYQHMEPYMGPALFAITMEAMKSEHDEICLQGIEFWSNVCDEEMDLAIEATEAEELGKPPDRTSRFYAKGALQFLVPTILEILTKQEEHDDEDEWNPNKAAGVCLMLLAQCCEDDVVPWILPFVQQNVKHQSWRHRDAAIMAFGSILEGPNPETLKPVVHEALPVIILLLKDMSVVVRDTAAWTVGRVCEMLPDVVIDPGILRHLLDALADGLAAEPRVAANVCWAFTSLAEAAYEAAERDSDEEPKTYALTPYFQHIVQRLLTTTDRLDGHQANLRSGAYEALMGMVKNSPTDCYQAVQATTLVILQRLEKVLEVEHQVSSSERAQFNDLQSLLCATLQSVLRKVTPADAPSISDAIMNALLRMFASNERSGGVHEDAMLAVSTLVEVLGDKFITYMDAFKPFLIMGLKNHAEYQVCLAAVGVVGDLCRALGRAVLPHCDEIMTLLCANLVDATVHRSVKPQILSVFGDTALAIGPEYRKYLDVVLTTLHQASMAQVNREDYDMIDYLNELRESCLEAYTGIVQGLKGDGQQPNPETALIQPHVPHIITFLEQIAVDDDRSDTVVGAAAGLIGDLLTTFGAEMAQVVDKEPLQALLTVGRRSRTAKTKQLSTWASREIRKLKSSAAAPGVPS